MSESRDQRVSIVIEQSLKDRLKALCEIENRKMSDFIRLIILDFVDYAEEQIAAEAEADENAKTA